MIRQKNRLSVGFLYDDTLDSSDGVAQYVKTLGAWLSRRGHKVSYLVGESNSTSFAGGRIHSLAKNIKVVFNGNNISMPINARKQAIRDLLRDEDFDLLHVQVPYSPLMAHYVIKHTPAKTAVIGTFHVFPASKLVIAGSVLLRFFLLSSLRRFDVMLSVSQPAAKFAKQAFSATTVVVPNVVDFGRFARSNGSTSNGNKHQIVFLGRLVKRKGCMELLKAVRVLNMSVPNISVTIAGDGPQRTVLEQYANDHKMEKYVKFIGFIPEEDKPKLLSSADIACFPSLFGESFGIVLLEAMASGAKVVLGGNNPGYASVLGARKELLVNPRDHIAFAKRMQQLLTDTELIKNVNQWQERRVKEYDVDKVGPRIEEIYLSSIAKRRSSGHN